MKEYTEKVDGAKNGPSVSAKDSKDHCGLMHPHIRYTTHIGQVHVVLELSTLNQPVAQLAVVKPLIVNPLDSGRGHIVIVVPSRTYGADTIGHGG